MPKNEDASEFELQNEANTGVMRGIGGAIEDTNTRQGQNSVNFYRGMFALMASFDWDKGKFSEHPQDVDLRNEAFELLNLPTHLSEQFSRAKADELIQSLGTSRGIVNSADERRSVDYIKSLVNLSKARFSPPKNKTK